MPCPLNDAGLKKYNEYKKNSFTVKKGTFEFKKALTDEEKEEICLLWRGYHHGEIHEIHLGGRQNNVKEEVNNELSRINKGYKWDSIKKRLKEKKWMK